MSTYMIVDGHGNALTSGLQGPEVSDAAEIAALRIATERGESVRLVPADGSDEGEEFTPVTVTDEQLEQLRTEAGTAGDRVQVAMCDRALGGDLRHRAACQRAIEAAAAQS